MVSSPMEPIHEIKNATIEFYNLQSGTYSRNSILVKALGPEGIFGEVF